MAVESFQRVSMDFGRVPVGACAADEVVVDLGQGRLILGMSR